MRYKSFRIQNYRGIEDVTIKMNRSLTPIIGLNESGKSTVLQALAHFDHGNDSATKDWQTRNRYRSSPDATITATVQITADEVAQSLNSLPEEVVEHAMERVKTEGQGDPYLEITRVFSAGSKRYAIGDMPSEDANNAAELILDQLPWLRYIPDILEHELSEKVEYPASPQPDTSTLNVEQRIVREIFSRSGTISIDDYVVETDRDMRRSRLNGVSDSFNAAVVKAWHDMHAEIEQLNDTSRSRIRLVIDDPGANNAFEFRVGEYVDGFPETMMKVSDRSTGFQWYFHFAVMKSYGLGSENSSVIYLIDEPGSHLHSRAQGTLLSTLQDLAAETPVIFTTHSEFLLDPEIVNPNDILVAEKKNLKVIVTPLSECEMSYQHGPLTPAYRALQTSIPLAATLNQLVITTEGITDFHFWKMTGKFDDVIFLPGTGAGNNRYHISLAIGSSRAYCALFDGDGAADRAITSYKKMFGNDEAANWLQYRLPSGAPVALEGLLTPVDQEALKTATGAKKLKTAISKLYYGDEATRLAFWSQLSDEGKIRIDSMAAVIRTALTH